MVNVMKRMGKSEKGFTLIELLAVIVILGVISAIAIPLIGNVISKSKTDSDLATARQVYDATRLYVTAELNGDFKTKLTGQDAGDAGLKIPLSTLQSAGYLEAHIYLPSTKAEITTGTVDFDAAGVLSSVTLAAKSFTSAQVLSAKS